MALALIVLGSLCNGLGVLLNMRYSMPNDITITVDGGTLTEDTSDLPKAKRQIRDLFNNMGYGLVIIGIVLNLIAPIVLYLEE